LGSDWCIEETLEPGETDTYSLTLPSDQYLRLVAQQWGIDLTLSLAAVDESMVLEVNGGGRWVVETLSAAAEGSGAYQIIVSAPATEKAAGSYQLKIEEIRSARATDTALIRAETALQEARLLYELSDEDSRNQALALLLEEVIDQWAELGDTRGEARAYFLLGQIHLANLEYEKALTALTRAVSLQELDPENSDLAQTLLEIGIVNYRLERFEEAHRHYLRALELTTGLCDRCLRVQAHNNLAVLLRNIGKQEEAQQQYEQALVLARDCGDARELLTVLSNLGTLTRRLGDPEKAFEYYTEALQVAEKLEDVSSRIAPLLNNLGVLYRMRGEPQKALDAYTKALELAQASGRRRVETYAATNLGYLYSILGEEERARELFDRALQLCPGVPRYESWVLRNIGWFHEASNRNREALAAYESALGKSTSPQNQGYALQGMGRVRLRLGEATAAHELLERALSLQVESGNLAGEQTILSDLADTNIMLGQLSRAEAALQRALSLSHQLASPYHELATRSSMVKLAQARGNLQEALRQSMLVIEAIESLRMEVVEPDFRASFLSRKQDDYVVAVELLMELHREAPADGYDGAAFAVAERARARSLVELLAEASVDAQAGVDPQLLAELHSAGGALSVLQRDLTFMLATEDQDQKQIDVHRQQIDQARQRLEQAESQVRKLHPRYAEIRYPEPIDYAQVCQLLDEETAFLEYVLGAERSYLFVLTRNQLSVEELPAAGKLVGAIRGMRTDLGRPGRRNLGRLSYHSQQLYKALIAPVAHRLAGVRRLVIAPDQELYHLPFEALVINQPASGRPTYLIDRWSTSYMPSGSVLNSMSQRGRWQAGADSPLLVAFADPPVPGRAPLPGSRQEVTRIAELLPADRVSLRLGPAASELFVKQSDMVADARFIHLACHGFLDEKSPAYSALQLAADKPGQDDGLLQVHEIFSLKLSADMVVLSACESGLGKEVRGEGLVGLTQAFLFAGAHSVVVSLWPVADHSTESLMVEFYSALQRGASRSEALRLAKLALLEEEAMSHPFYWSPFVLIGD
jgi:CHAT domain-containing protein/Tfp pilus assembly protein PilF